VCLAAQHIAAAQLAELQFYTTPANPCVCMPVVGAMWSLEIHRLMSERHQTHTVGMAADFCLTSSCLLMSSSRGWAHRAANSGGSRPSLCTSTLCAHTDGEGRRGGRCACVQSDMGFYAAAAGSA
jgi:hypothetical protein